MSPFPRRAYRLLSRYTPDRRPVEVDLSDNTNRWGTHPAALKVIREAGTEDLTRYPPAYADRLRSTVAQKFGVPADCVATGCGSDDLFDSTFRAGGEPGESVAYLPPTFSMLEIFVRMNGMRLRPVSLGEGSDPRAMLHGDPALVYLCRPNNPTGEVIPRPWVESLLEAAGPRGPIILVDEAYADFADDNFLSDAARSSRLLVLRTFSKAYGLAGLRVAFAVGPAEVILEVEKSRGPYKVSGLAESAAVAALEDEEGWVPEVVTEVKNQRDRLREELEHRGWASLPSGANFLLLPLRGRTAAGVTAGLRERGVAVRPFPDLPGIGESIRVSIGPRGQIDRFLRALDEVLV